MKKRISKICSILTASALLAVSVTAYAESDDIEAGFQAEEESDVPMETQEFQTETGSLESETELMNFSIISKVLPELRYVLKR